MNEKEITRISKFLSLVLRHQPELIGLHLDDSGWADVSQLLEKSARQGTVLTFDTLKTVVDTNSKKRFAFNDAFDKIRASQGHSIVVDLGYSPQIPLTVLYHGTADKSAASIINAGIEKRSRQHVHLSADMETAVKVGQRHGKPVVLQVAAIQMHQDGFKFFLSANGVWLTDHVPAKYLSYTGE